MSPAVKRALAYCRATGSLPSHLHLETWIAARKLLVDEPYMIGDYQTTRQVLGQEAKAATDSHPLWLAVCYLKARGYRLERISSRRNTSHYIAFTHPDKESRATAYRSGGGSITDTLRTESDEFIRNETRHFSKEEAATKESN